MRKRHININIYSLQKKTKTIALTQAPPNKKPKKKKTLKENFRAKKKLATTYFRYKTIVGV